MNREPCLYKTSIEKVNEVLRVVQRIRNQYPGINKTRILMMAQEELELSTSFIRGICTRQHFPNATLPEDWVPWS